MKQSMTFEELRTEVARQVLSRQDFVVAQKEIQYRAAGETISFMGQTFPLTDLSHRQLAGALKIPFGHYQRLRTNHADLHHLEVNRLLSETDKGRMVRTLDGKTRAIVGKRFLRVDSDQLMEILVPQLEGLGLVVESAHVDTERLFVKAFTTTLEGEVGPGDVIRGGFLFSNSEVGLGKIWIASMIEWVANKNGAIAGSTLGTYERRHVGPAVSVDEETGMALNEVVPSFVQMSERIRASIASALSNESFHQLLLKLRTTKTMLIPAGLDLETLVVRLRRRLGLTDSESSRFLAHLTFEDRNLYGLMQALCRLAQDAFSYERATELEVQSGALLEIAPREWAALTELPPAPSVAA